MRKGITVGRTTKRGASRCGWGTMSNDLLSSTMGLYDALMMVPRLLAIGILILITVVWDYTLLMLSLKYFGWIS